MGETIKWKGTGGVCDGNFTASVGTPTIDTLGPIGGNLHTADEYIIISSMHARTKLITRFLMQIAADEINLL
jgi:glutamate carboxypeptidase